MINQAVKAIEVLRKEARAIKNAEDKETLEKYDALIQAIKALKIVSNQ